MIRLSNLNIGYSRDSPVMTHLNYVFEDKIYGILGQSGCGKTTLLRTIAGLTRPLAGQVIYNKSVITTADKNDIYMMHQNYTSFDWLTCLENILIARKIRGEVTHADIVNAIQWLENVQLKGYEDKFPKQLSGGQRQRLALARTLFMNPNTILMDEPLSALDVITREYMQNLIMRNHHVTGNTVIMVTHSAEEARRMCDVVIKLQNNTINMD